MVGLGVWEEATAAWLGGERVGEREERGRECKGEKIKVVRSRDNKWVMHKHKLLQPLQRLHTKAVTYWLTAV